MQWSELMMSQLTAITCNGAFARPERPVGMFDFMLHPFPQAKIPVEPPGETIRRLLRDLPPGTAYEM